MTICRLIIRQPWTTTLVRGPLSSNSWHVDTGGAPLTSGAATAIAGAILPVYQINDPVILGSILSGDVEWSAIDLADPPPRLPIEIGAGTAQVAAACLPGECTVNVSFAGERESGVPSQRRRGRVQLGPIAPAAVGPTGLITDTAGGAVAEAVSDMRAAIEGLGFEWVVGSPEWGYVPITKAWVSNECGTTRRRQLPETQRYPITT